MSKQLNFAQQMDEVLKTLGPQRPKLLLHACCGPCSSAVLEKLCRYFEITVLYYNPNTWPAEEYYRRGEELKKFVAQAHPLGGHGHRGPLRPAGVLYGGAGAGKRAGAGRAVHRLLPFADAPGGTVRKGARL